jgi:hypothetical protein
MFKTKRLAGALLIIIAILFAQAGNVAAAPQLQDGTTTTITGTIKSIETQLDENNEIIVLVTVQTEEGTQTISLTAQEAADNLLFNLDTQELLVAQGDEVKLVVDPNDVVLVEEVTEDDVHPIAWILAEFFDEDASVVNEYHEDGFGFGVIAQAMWMSRNITGTEEETGDASLAWDILQAKQEKDFQTFFDEHEEYFVDLEGDVPTNWGQFRKSLLEKKNNLGFIVSEQEGQDDTIDSSNQDTVNPQDHGNNKDKGKDNGKGRDKQKKKP